MRSFFLFFFFFIGQERIEKYIELLLRCGEYDENATLKVCRWKSRREPFWIEEAHGKVVNLNLLIITLPRTTTIYNLILFANYSSSPSFSFFIHTYPMYTFHWSLISKHRTYIHTHRRDHRRVLRDHSSDSSNLNA